jgi:glycosyltransferase involved in cell wall biosynthesis
MDSLRVCVVTPEFLPVWGGVGTYIVELVKNLPKDLEVHVVTPMRGSLGGKNVSSRDFDFSEYFSDNVHVHFVSNATDTFFYNGVFQLACLRYIPKLVDKENIDLLHFGNHVAGLLDRLKGLNTPAVTTVHTTIQGQRNGARISDTRFRNLEFSEKATFLTYPFLRLAETVYFSRIRHYITVSEWMKRQLQEQYPKIKYRGISVIHNSVDTRVFCPTNKRKTTKDIVLFTGRILAVKGLRYLIEAVPRILKEHSEAFFLFIGPGDFSSYQRRLKDLGVSEDNFAFLGFLKDRSELVEYLRSSSVYVAPTLYENLPYRILEAMACGAPVVASNIAAIPEALRNDINGLLVEPGSVDDLVDAVCLLLTDSALRKRIGYEARKTVLEKFDSEVNASRTVGVYQKVLSQSQP